MANIELRKSFFGDALVGHVEPALSWSDRRALTDAARSSAAATAELERLNRQMGMLHERLGDLGGVVLHGLAHLEGQLGLRLEMQTQVLTRQLEHLEQIDQTLRTPAKTRAAERIADTGELLRRGRWERALESARQAIEDDPNNPAGFRAAAWACLGLEHGEDAQRHFLECADAADGDERSQALRQAARLALALDDAEAALRILNSVDDQTGPAERTAVAYDRGVYLAEADREDEAKAILEPVFGEDERFALWALTDRLLAEHPQLTELAAERVRELTQGLATLRHDMDAAISEAGEHLDVPEPAGSESLPPWAEDRRAGLRVRAEALREQVESARARHDGRLIPLRDELVGTLSPASVALVGDVDAWRADVDAWRIERANLRARAEALQASVADAAAELARANRAEVRPSDGCMTVGSGLEVYSALVTRQMKPFRPGKAWIVTLDRDGQVVVRKTSYRY